MQVALFATCLVDLIRPSVGFSAIKLLEQAGCTVNIPQNQTCCGQPAFNNGDRENACFIAKQVIDEFEGYDYVIVPSGSCAGMIKLHYPEMLSDDAQYYPKAKALSSRCYELTSFLVDVAHFEPKEVSFNEKVTYHDSCSCQRELSVKTQPRTLLNKVKGLELCEMQGTEECCGFGGTFCIKYDELSTIMVDNKVNLIKQSGADTLLAADLGCLLNIAGRIKRLNLPIRVFHVAEILAGMAKGNGIGGEE